MTMKEIDFEAQVEKEIADTKRIIGRRDSGVASAIALPGDTIYGAVVESLSERTRNTPAQINYLNAYEKALAVFRASSLELRKAIDILSLEERLGTLTTALKDSVSPPEANSGRRTQIEDLRL
jgi:hypothetical protein